MGDEYTPIRTLKPFEKAFETVRIVAFGVYLLLLLLLLCDGAVAAAAGCSQFVSPTAGQTKKVALLPPEARLFWCALLLSRGHKRPKTEKKNRPTKTTT